MEAKLSQFLNELKELNVLEEMMTTQFLDKQFPNNTPAAKLTNSQILVRMKSSELEEPRLPVENLTKLFELYHWLCAMFENSSVMLNDLDANWWNTTVKSLLINPVHRLLVKYFDSAKEHLHRPFIFLCVESAPFEKLQPDLVVEVAGELTCRQEYDCAWKLLEKISPATFSLDAVKMAIIVLFYKRPQEPEIIDRLFREYRGSQDDITMLTYFKEFVGRNFKWNDLKLLYENTSKNNDNASLTAAMVEVCVLHRQYEYGWSTYEKNKEKLDRHVARSVSLLCRDAFFKDPFFEIDLDNGKVLHEDYLDKTKWEGRCWAFYKHFLELPWQELDSAVSFVLHNILEVMSDSPETPSRLAKVSMIYNQLKKSSSRSHIKDDHIVNPILRLCLKCLSEVEDDGSHDDNNFTKNLSGPFTLKPDRENAILFYQKAFEVYQDFRGISLGNNSNVSSGRIKSEALRRRFSGSKGKLFQQPLPTQVSLPNVIISLQQGKRPLEPQTFLLLIQLCLIRNDSDRFYQICCDLSDQGVTEWNEQLLKLVQFAHDNLLHGKAVGHEHCKYDHFLFTEKSIPMNVPIAIQEEESLPDIPRALEVPSLKKQLFDHSTGDIQRKRTPSDQSSFFKPNRMSVSLSQLMKGKVEIDPDQGQLLIHHCAQKA